MVPDLAEGGLGDVSAFYIRVAARLYDTGVGNETESRTGQATPCHGVESMGLKGDRFAFCFCPLT